MVLGLQANDSVLAWVTELDMENYWIQHEITRHDRMSSWQELRVALWGPGRFHTWLGRSWVRDEQTLHLAEGKYWSPVVEYGKANSAQVTRSVMPNNAKITKY